MKKILLVVCLIAACERADQTSGSSTATQTSNQTAAQATKTAQTTVQVEVKEAPPQKGLDAGTEEQQQMLIRAKADFLNENWDAAQVVFEKLATTGPVSGPQVTAMIALAEIYKEKGEKAKAFALYQDLLARAPDVAEVQFIGGRALAESGETSKAIAAYERAITLDANYLQAYVELGALYVKSGREDDAGKIYLAYEQRIYGLAKILEDKNADPLEKLEALEIFSFVQDDRANQAIMTALGDTVPEVRERAVTLAEEFGIGEAIEHVTKMAIEDPDTRVRVAARAAAERMKGAPIEGSRPTFVTDPKQVEVPAP